MSRALDFFRKNKAQNTIAVPPAAARSDVGEKNNLIRAPERPKSSPSYPRPEAPSGSG